MEFKNVGDYSHNQQSDLKYSWHFLLKLTWETILYAKSLGFPDPESLKIVLFMQKAGGSSWENSLQKFSFLVFLLYPK